MRFGIGQQRLHLRLGESTGIGNAREVFPIVVESLHVGLGRDPHHDQFAPFIGAANSFDFHARGGCGQRPIVLQLIGVIRELPRGPDVIAQHVPWCGNASDHR